MISTIQQEFSSEVSCFFYALQWKKGGKMPCPSFNISIVQRSRGESAVAASAYQSGETLHCKYDGQVKDYAHKDRVVYTEVMLPPNAPPEYADRQTLWNSAEAAERSWKSQLARRFKIALPRELTPEQNRQLVRQFCKEQFVAKGMIVDIAIHDSGNGNPHFHVLTTMRAMDEQGRWLPKCRKEYVLDDNGERVRLSSGQWKSRKVDTVDWNDQKYGEIWRHEWEKLQNQYLEKANCTERVDMRSYERQGIERLPQVHLGAAAAFERKGIQTELGNVNRQIVEKNNAMDSLHKVIGELKNWIADISRKIAAHEIITAPDDHDLATLLMAYMDLRKDERSNWSVYAQRKGSVADLKKFSEALIYLQSNDICAVGDLAERLNVTSVKIQDFEKSKRKNTKRIRDIADVIKASATMQKYQAVWAKYTSIKWKSAKQSYYDRHTTELEAYKKADRLLRKLNVTLPLDELALKTESKELVQNNEKITTELAAAQDEMSNLKDIRYCVRKVMPDALPTKTSDGRMKLEEQLESLTNTEELRKLTEDETQQHEKRSKQNMKDGESL